MVIGVWFLCRVEGWVRRRLPDALDTVFAPLLTLLLVLAPSIGYYLIGLAISVLAAFILTWFMLGEDTVKES